MYLLISEFQSKEGCNYSSFTKIDFNKNPKVSETLFSTVGEITVVFFSADYSNKLR